MKITSIFFAILGMASRLLAQTDSLATFYLDEVLVEDKLIRTVIALNIVEFDSALLSNNEGSTFPELARRNGFLESRSYGANGLSQAGIRGTGGAHTAIIWNGINLQSPLTGTADLSLIAINATDQLSIIKGGAAAQYGSGAIGGVINIGNKIPYHQGLKVSATQEVGSFENHYQKYSAQWSNETVGAKVSCFSRGLANDYSYVNTYVRPEREEIRQHAALRQSGITTETEFKINLTNQIGFRSWIQSNEIKIPNSILTTPNKATQKDSFGRYMLYWNHANRKYSLSLRSAFLTQETSFSNQSTNFASANSFRSVVTNLALERDLGTGQLISGFNHRNDQSNVSAFGDDQPTRNIYSGFGSLLWSWRNFDASLTARQEIYDNQLAPFLPSIGLVYHVGAVLLLSGNASRNYRIPTLNDLYWKGAGGLGNPNLRPESSLNYELGFQLKLSDEFQLSSTGYSYNVKNRIQWRPLTPAVWTPDNIKRVRSRGLDSSLKGELLNNKKLKLSYYAGYLYSIVTNKEVSEVGDEKELNKQLTYSPKHSGSMQGIVCYESFNATITWNYVGTQFTEGENKKIFSVDAYSTVNLLFSKSWVFDKISGSLRLSANNILNENYENRRGYPMYRRNYLIGLTLNFL